jgi:hypothetical protein
MSWNYFIRSVIHPLPFSEFIFILNSDLDPVNKMFSSSPNFSSFCFAEIRQAEGKRAGFYGIGLARYALVYGSSHSRRLNLV